MSFYEYKCSNRLYFKSNLFNDRYITHGFTSKLGGISRGKVDGLNLGFRVGDDINSVKENYRLVADDLKIDLDRTVLSKQTHTDNIRIVTKEDSGKGIVRESDIEDTDGLITDIPGIALVVFSADCTPVLMYDKETSVAAAVHAGWRGTVKGISGKCVDIMVNKFNSNPKNIVVAIGPSIGPCCFEFGSEASDIFDPKYITKLNDGKYLINIWEANRDQLTSRGILPENIDVSQICTVCNSDKLYSYRTHGVNTGRQGAIIMLKG